MGPCTSWPFVDDCECLPDGVDEYLLDAKLEQATIILWGASGRRIGTCPVTIRPCLRRCGGGFGLWVPYKDGGGEWRNFAACGCRTECSCTELSEIVLPGPVASITEVLVDGVVVPPEDYRLDNVGGQWRLVRLLGSWPECSDMTADCGDVGAFCVTYEQGIEPDALAIAAVSEAACELVKACIPGCKTCKLPANVRSVVRRGVAIDLEVVKAAVLALPTVASFIATVNPNGLMSASSVWSPDVPRPRVTT